MGKAISYALAQWESLEVYLKEPGIEIDTNPVENAKRSESVALLILLTANCREGNG
jgi:hypothetical protein